MTPTEHIARCKAEMAKQVAKLKAQMDANEAWHRANPALREANRRRDAEQDREYRETFGLPDMNPIEARKHVGLAKKRAA